MQFPRAVAQLTESGWEDCYDLRKGGGGKEKSLRDSYFCLVKRDPYSSLLVGV